MAFKQEVLSLIDSWWLTFQEDNPNVRMNPLVSHWGSTVNAAEECGPRGPKRMEDVLTFRRFILEALLEAGMVCLDGDMGDSCLVHPGASHDVEACSMVEDLLQRIMDKGLIKVCGSRKGGGDVCMQSVDKSPSKPKPLVIHFTRDVAAQKPRGFQPVPVEKPAPFPYKSDKAVPWRYASQGLDRRKYASVVHVKGDLSSAKVTNISGTSDMTHSGRIFTTLESPVQSNDPKGKAKAGMEESNNMGPIPDEEVSTGRFAKEEVDFSRKGIYAEEAIEFPRIIQ